MTMNRTLRVAWAGLLLVGASQLTASAQAPDVSGLLWSVADGKSSPWYGYVAGAKTAYIHAQAVLDKAQFPGDPKATPQTYPQIKYNKNTCTLKVEKLDAQGGVVPNTAQTFLGTVNHNTSIADCVTTLAAMEAANPGIRVEYNGFAAATYRVTLTAEVLVTTPLSSTTRDAVVSATVIIYPPPP
jgi:hypothetical protein